MSEPSAAVAERMAPETRETVKAFTDGGYKYGFVTDIETETIPPGLNEDVIRLLSAKKNEPQFFIGFSAESLRQVADDDGANLAKGGLPENRL